MAPNSPAEMEATRAAAATASAWTVPVDGRAESHTWAHRSPSDRERPRCRRLDPESGVPVLPKRA